MRHNKPAYKKYLILFLFVIFSCSVIAQGNSATVPQLVTTGLANEQLLRNIFTGNFANIDFDRDEPGFSLILDAYINAYFEHCSASLPDDKVEITYQECVRWVDYKNGYGTIVRTDCLEWGTHHTNVYASPAMYKAKTMVDALQTGDVFRNMFKILKQDNPIGVGEQYVQQGIILKQDMSSFFSMNDCNSAGIKRFEQNLYAFATNKLPVVLEDSQMHRQDPNVLLKNQDFNKLVDDLVYDQSANWMMNVYVPHNVTDVKITSRDAAGRPATLTADYQFKSGRSERTGSTTLTFTDGLPNCLYFFDFPNTCRTANRKIVANYANGGYVSQ